MNKDLAFLLIGTAARLVPEVAEWLRELVNGRTDRVSLRVADILPEKSESQKALEETGKW